MQKLKGGRGNFQENHLSVWQLLGPEPEDRHRKVEWIQVISKASFETCSLSSFFKNWLLWTTVSSKGSTRTNDLVDSNLTYICAYYFTSTNQSNQWEVQKVKLVQKGQLHVWVLGSVLTWVSPLSQGWATLCSLNRPSLTGSWAGKRCYLQAAQWGLSPLSSQRISALVSVFEMKGSKIEVLSLHYGINMHFRGVLSLVIISQCCAGFLMSCFCLSYPAFSFLLEQGRPDAEWRWLSKP